MTNLQNHNFYSQIVDLLQSARQQVLRTVNKTMVITYFEIGRKIVEEEQNGNERAEYGKSLLKELSKVLTKEFGKGFSVYNLERMRKFYYTYKDRNIENDISATLLRNFELSWSHYLTLMRMDNENERKFHKIFVDTNSLLNFMH